MTAAGLILAAAIGYAFGSVPVAVWVGRRHGVDPRTVGDRNPGYWNTKQTLGARAALPVFVGDTAKGAAAGLAGLAVAAALDIHAATGHSATGHSVGRSLVYVAVAAAMVGHAYPVFARFAGGRSILTFAGGMAVVSPPTFVVCVVLSLIHI